MGVLAAGTVTGDGKSLAPRATGQAMTKPGFTRLLAASAASALLVLTPYSMPSAFAQSEQQFIKALSPVPPALRGPSQGLPSLPPVAAPPRRHAPIKDVSAEGPAAPVARHHPRDHHPIASAKQPIPAPNELARRGCAADVTDIDKPMQSSRVEFEFGSAKLKPSAIKILRNLGNALNSEKLKDQKSFEIDGHTDAVGSFAYNKDLSRMRAEAVKDFLVNEMHVAPERLTVVGRSFCDPADPRHPDAAVNRRVVVINQSS